MIESEIKFNFFPCYIKGIHIITGTTILIYGAKKSKAQLKSEVLSRLEELVHKF